MFGANADIRTGDFAFTSPYVRSVTSLGSDMGHAWCAVSGIVPVDLSLTFRHFGVRPQLSGPIIGTGKNGDWHVTYGCESSHIGSYREESNDIMLIERQIESHTAEELLQNPYRFLYPPQDNDGGSWNVLFGQDIYAKVTLHCFLAASGRAKKVRFRFNSREAVRWICNNYPDAVGDIRNKLKATAINL